MRNVWILAFVAGTATVPHDYERTVLQAREAESKRVTGPYSWFSLVGLQPLVAGDVSVGSAAGNTLRLEHGAAHAFTLHVADGKVTLGSADPSLSLEGRQAHRGDVVLPAQSDVPSLRWGDLWANVIQRTGNQILLRVGDRHSTNLRHFHGLNFYPVDPAYRVTARYTPYPAGHEMRMGTVLGTMLALPSPGYVELAIDGRTVRLDAALEGKSLSLPFRDGTYRSTTYGAGRQLSADVPSNGLSAEGTVVVDFNTATNWPCAYTEYGTCPLPPPQNRFDVPVPAGEKRYHP